MVKRETLAEYKRQWAIQNRNKVRRYQQAYYARNKKKCNEKTRRWQHAHWEHFLETQNKYRKKRYRSDKEYREYTLKKNHLEYRKHRAHYLVYGAKKRKQKLQYRSITLLNNAIRRGDIIRPDSCENCNKICVPDGHHYKGYQHPLTVVWLCRYCHRVVH